MTGLEELLKYWRQVYPIGYAQRLAKANENILATIRYLEELQKIKGGAQ